MLEGGGSINQETRGWDEDAGKTFPQRDKEDAHDYRYFPDPDLPPIVIDEARIKQVQESMNPLPPAIRESLSKAGVQEEKFDTLMESELFTRIVLTALDEEVPAKALKRMVNWLTVEVQTIEIPEESLELTFSHLSELNDMVEAGELSSTAAKEVLAEISEQGGSAKDIATAKNLIQVSDSGEIEKFVDTVLRENPQAVADIKAGENKAIGFLVGQVMKLSKGQANPGMVNKLISDKVAQIDQ